MDFQHSPKAQEYIDRLSVFMDQHVYPVEEDYYDYLDTTTSKTTRTTRTTETTTTTSTTTTDD